MLHPLHVILASTVCLVSLKAGATGDRPVGATPAGAVLFTRGDREALLGVLERLSPDRGEPVAELTARAGLALVGTPYVAGTLDGPGPERLVCDLRGLDCMTFVESALAIARTRKCLAASAGPRAARSLFEAELAALRYRQYPPSSYASRLHYFSDWIDHNERRGVVEEITRSLGGEADSRPVDFMTVHVDRYPPLADPEILGAVGRVEAQLTHSLRWILPVADVPRAESGIHEGDILALVPGTPGLDVSHLGLAHRTPDGVLHLLNASSIDRKVEVSAGSLTDYLKAHPKIVGIRVVRPL